ncbi:hypothetical protein PR202_ga21026 [Eleusine coracana subsp. coracana]|uniref:Uncharacterized protein n=1 Tax=Eleusine coracana subsp. coracana TaxID=191504 RepID=A0AAV5CZZ8_ELECO|nr:hypothetical protein PR202_ga21026 [Eleusine coracana subsp. coracana]
MSSGRRTCLPNEVDDLLVVHRALLLLPCCRSLTSDIITTMFVRELLLFTHRRPPTTVGIKNHATLTFSIPSSFALAPPFLPHTNMGLRTRLCGLPARPGYASVLVV